MIGQGRLGIVVGLLAISLCAACGSSSSSQAQPSSPATATTTSPAANPGGPLKEPGEAVVGEKTTCPISGEEFVVTASSPKVEHNGKTYYFCCGGCDQKFAKDPEKALKDMKAKKPNDA